MGTFGQGIKTIGRGTIAVSSGTSNTATITAVDTSKTELRYCGHTSSEATAKGCTGKLYLTNSTTITASIGDTVAVSGSSFTYEYTEYY